ncbi:MAG: hypothetical protein QOH66_620 [Actinomycetota bacterium]|jgi:hypothetical protein|nr:hypothetical protein [Actinomycetota bacterium]
MTFQTDLEARVRYEAAVIAGKARETLERELQRAAPVGTPNPYQTHEPGMLRDSIAVNVRFDQTTFTFHAEASAPHASFTDSDTSPHPIIAVNTRFLRFDWPRGGRHPAFVGPPPTHFVQHPGTTGTGWWTKTLERWPDILGASQ